MIGAVANDASTCRVLTIKLRPRTRASAFGRLMRVEKPAASTTMRGAEGTPEAGLRFSCPRAA